MSSPKWSRAGPAERGAPRDSLDRNFSRRQALRTGGAALFGGAISAAPSARLRAEPAEVRGFACYRDLLDAVRERGHKARVLGYAPDRSPIVAVRCGGDRQPPIFISAGSHATEHAGVLAAVALIDQLKTRHQVWVVPTRDPIGLNGFRYALSLSLGEEPQLESLEEAAALLREKGEPLYRSGDGGDEEDETLLVLIGELGYATRGLYRKVKKGAKFLAPLRGRRIYFPSRWTDRPGAGPLERAYTLVVTPDGEVLHLNRFHDTAWAPAEVRCVRKLMAGIRPRLTFDLHEYGGDSFWMSARRQQTEEDETWERRMAAQAARALAASGARLAPSDYSSGSFFEKLEPGVFWLDPSQRGEGLNLIDFAARRHGPGFTIETGMRGPLADRVRQQMLVVQTAVRVFESRYS